MIWPSRHGSWKCLISTLGYAFLTCGFASAPSVGEEVEHKVDFDRDIRPILSDNCYACHGPDEKQRKAGLRLDIEEGAFRELEDGIKAIVPEKPDESELIFRVEMDDPTIQMPPPDFGKTLNAEQVGLLRTWIEQGAEWTSHWAFVPPKRPDLPAVAASEWPKSPTDRFILSRLEKAGLHPSPEADKETLIRRVTLDLTGLPPTPEEVDAFLADETPEAYERLVDRLLQSPRYGEHMARYWLDAARYGDTHGLHLDNYREMWPYREWVIKAFNENKPFDQFIIEQMAGDLLPNPTLDQLIASGFNRCNVTTNEGGSIAEEVYVRNVIDRVETNGTVFLGMTIGCARCHDHKYDPITTRNFYQLFAFFNSLDGNPMDGNAEAHPPVVKVPSPEQERALAEAVQKIESLKSSIKEAVAKVEYDATLDESLPEFVQRSDYIWIEDDLPRGASPTENGAWTFETFPSQPVHAGDKSVDIAGDGLNQRAFEKASDSLHVGEGDSLFAYVFLDPTNPPKEIMLQWHTDGWKHRAYWGANVIDWGKDNSTERFHVGPLPVTGKWVRIEVEAAKVGLKPGSVINGWAYTQQDGHVTWDHAGIETWTPQQGQTFQTLSEWVRTQRAGDMAALPANIKEIVKTERGKRNDEQKKQLQDYFVEHAYEKTRSIFDPLHDQIAKAEKEREQTDQQIPTTLVFRELNEPKPAFILKRGEYDQKGEPVERGIPEFLPPLPEGAPRDRLGFAQWLVAENHPLTARVAVNRFWQHCFGIGLVKTSEDFGSQGEPPSHPELLDWLAVQFREDGWDVKQFMKQLVMSATYRQSSRITPDRLAKDPRNRLLSRGPRFRLDAEMLRDQALAVSGLLVEKIGGPSVKPPQPPGLWEAVGYTSSNTAKFTPDHGVEKVHRRSLYTFWKRTAPPPEMNTFDAPSRESCTVRRERTNTPLQALLLMNDPQFVEPARALAERVLKETPSASEERIKAMFRLVTARWPDATEVATLHAAFQDHLDHFVQHPEAARRLISIGERKPDESLAPSELASWTMIANLILNLDEVINKE